MTRKPNFLFIITDQQRYDCLSCHDHPTVKTPHIDRLAQQGVDYRRCFSQSAICMPSRIAALTSQYLHTHGIQSNAKDADTSHLTTLPQVLKENGYRTGVIGKSHIGNSSDMGFDYKCLCAGMASGETNAYEEYLNHHGLSEDGVDRAYKEGDAYVSSIPYKHSLEAWTGEEAIRFIDQPDSENPFFLYLNFERPHAPTSVPADNPFPYDPEAIQLPPHDERFYTKPGVRRPGCENAWSIFSMGEQKFRQTIANYYTLISMIDDQVGRVVAHLEKTGQLENTVIIFTSDHGDFGGDFGQFGKNVSTFDALYHIPLIWYWQGVTDREPLYELTELIDVMPTILDLANIPIPRSAQGTSLAPAILGSGKRRGGDMYLTRDAVFFETPFVKTVRTQTHKLSVCYHGEQQWGHLYDLVEDPAEMNNLYDRPDQLWIQRKLECRLLQWFIETQQPQVFGNPNNPSHPNIRWFTEGK